jgi:hypothetical protein
MSIAEKPADTQCVSSHEVRAKAAKALGLEVPPSLLARADEVLSTGALRLAVMLGSTKIISTRRTCLAQKILLLL